MTTDLDALAASFETRRGTPCSVCRFIEDRPEDEQPQWDALFDGPHTATGVFGAMRARGFTADVKKNVVDNHRREHHRGCRLPRRAS